MNKFSCLGRVGSDPKVRETQSGDQVASFSLAVDQGYGKNKSTTWFSVNLFGKRVGVTEYIHKGDRLCVSGEIVNRQYKSKDGSEKMSLEIVNADITLVEKRNDSEDNSDGFSTPKPTNKPPKMESNSDPFGDDVPF